MRAKAAGRQREIGPEPVDIHVAKRVRQRRIELGISQPKLGAALGVTFQQVYKYEKAVTPYQRRQALRFEQGARRARHLLFRGHRGDRHAGAEAEATEGRMNDLRFFVELLLWLVLFGLLSGLALYR